MAFRSRGLTERLSQFDGRYELTQVNDPMMLLEGRSNEQTRLAGEQDRSRGELGQL
jgi:hypothetical protein